MTGDIGESMIVRFEGKSRAESKVIPRESFGSVFHVLPVRGNVDRIDILLGLLAVCAYTFLS